MDINSLQYFNSQVCELRNQWGYKTFWEDLNKIQLAMKALAHLYFNIKLNPQDEAQAAITFEATVLEFNRRAMYAGIYVI